MLTAAAQQLVAPELSGWQFTAAFIIGLVLIVAAMPMAFLGLPKSTFLTLTAGLVLVLGSWVWAEHIDTEGARVAAETNAAAIAETVEAKYGAGTDRAELVEAAEAADSQPPTSINGVVLWLPEGAAKCDLRLRDGELSGLVALCDGREPARVQN